MGGKTVVAESGTNSAATAARRFDARDFGVIAASLAVIAWGVASLACGASVQPKASTPGTEATGATYAEPAPKMAAPVGVPCGKAVCSPGERCAAGVCFGGSGAQNESATTPTGNCDEFYASVDAFCRTPSGMDTYGAYCKDLYVALFEVRQELSSPTTTPERRAQLVSMCQQMSQDIAGLSGGDER